MKNGKKALLALGLAAMSAASLAAFASCGGAAESTGVYLSNNDLSYTNFLPTYNYFTASIGTQEIETFSDNTYVLTINKVNFSNISLGPDVATGEETWNDRGQVSVKYYGTFTSVEDEGDLTLTLSAPTKLVYEEFGYVAMDSTKTYGEEFTYTPMGGEAISYADKIAQEMAKFNGAEVYINGAGASFKQIKIG